MENFTVSSKDQSVTVIVPTFNRADLIAASLDSILNQEHPPEEIIIVNDGSTDETEDILSAYQDRIKILYQENSGKPAAINNALGHVVTKWVWIFDDDDIALPTALSEHLKALVDNPAATFSYSGFWFAEADESGELKRTALEPTFEGKDRTLFDALLDDCVLSLQGMLIDRETILALGGFDAGMLRAEDYEFFLRLTKSHEGAYIEAPTYLRRVHTGVRGPKTQRHTANDTRQIFVNYEREIFARLYQETDLRDFVRYGSEKCFPRDEFTGLVRRVSTMMKKAVWNFAASDLREIAAQGLERDKLTDLEKHYLRRSLHPSFVAEQLGPQSELVKVVRQMPDRGALAQVKEEICTSYIVGLWRQNEGRPLKAFGIILSAMRLFGLRYALRPLMTRLIQGRPKQQIERPNA